MTTGQLLRTKQVKALKDYYRDSNKQFAEWTTIGTKATGRLERLTDSMILI
jgi:hypothetical protein